MQLRKARYSRRGSASASLSDFFGQEVIELFTHRGESVSDPFNRISTTFLAAKDLERNTVGFGMEREICNLSNYCPVQTRLVVDTKQMTVCDDARKNRRLFETWHSQTSSYFTVLCQLLNRRVLTTAEAEKE
jgi:hypothetical protein